MVKGISKQVIVVNASEKELFEQAIFILSDNAVKDKGITEEKLLQQANILLKGHRNKRPRRWGLYCAVCFLVGTLTTGMLWVISLFL